MLNMLCLMQTTHVSYGWIHSWQSQWLWSQRKWQSTSTTGHRGGLAAQTEILRQLVQAQQQQRGGHHAHQLQEASYQDFLRTQPPLFTKAEEPLDADTWIRMIQSKFSLLPVPCSEVNNTRYATQQLCGSARMWWDHYHWMLPADHVVNWNEFKGAFRAHHIPAGLLDRKLNEFLALTQGNRTVLQYAQAFNHLC